MIACIVALALQLVGGSVLKISSEDAHLFKMKILSKEEIMANMTSARALSTVLKSRGIGQRPKLAALLRTELTEHLKGSTTARRIKAHNKADPDKDAASKPKGYAALDGARDMLNEMMADAQTKLDNEGEKCQIYNTETLSLLEQVRQDVASFNSQAADARSRVLKAQSIIGFVEIKLPQVKDELEKHNKECARQEAELNKQIAIVMADLDVMAGILKIIGDCGSGDAGAALLQCRHCKGAGEGYVMLQDDRLQPLINKLKTAAAKRVLQDNLNKLYEDTAKDQEPVALTQEEVRRQTMIMMGETISNLRGTRLDPEDDPELMAATGPEIEGMLNTSKVPDVTQPVDCIPTNKCTLGKGSCPKIRDRFLYIQSGIQDSLDKLKDELSELQRRCLEEKQTMEAQISNLNEKLSVAQTDLAVATKEQVDSESSSNLKAQHHKETTTEYGKTMKDCCDEQNDLKSELCALEKIRGELYKMKGQNVFITDCQVSDWKESKCSASCGGGYLIKTRSIIVHPVDGMACPPLQMKESCNTEACPIDCIVGDWEGWSGCSAECGGGVRERMRPVLQEMRYGGEPCEETQETEGCNAQACNKACELAEWTEWSSCTQACMGGTQRKTRPVAVPAVGTGICPPADAEPERITFRPCNTKPCTEFYIKRDNGNFLECDSKADIIILMDGSGSLGEYGWEKSKVFVENLLRNLKGGDDNVKVALQLFSGPTTWESYFKCIGQSDEAPDMEKDCQIKWIKHLTTNTLEAAETVEKLEFPAATTLTSVALGEAEAELINGREDASSTVIVVTDGWPLSQTRTKEAAHKLMEKARVIWVPVGKSAPLELIEELASLPKKENIIEIDDFKKLGWSYFANKVLAQTCPTLTKAK